MRVVIAVFLAGCFSPAPRAGAACASNGDCPDGLECAASNTCEKPGTQVEPDACPGTACDGDTLIGCGSSTTCAYGCGGATPHCLELAPSNGVTVALLAGVTADVSIADLDFDTDNGRITVTDDAMVTTEIRAAGAGVIAGIGFELVEGNGVFSANSWNIATLEDADATGAPPFVLFARTTITVTTTLDAGGLTTNGGPGATSGNNSTAPSGCRGRAGRNNTAIGAAFGEGGGGGGAVTAGGDGGPSNQANPTGGGGTVCAPSPTTIPLRGGSGGGHGGQATGNGGGGGGGAVMLVAMGSIDVSGAIVAPGAGGLSATTGSGGGGGGGSGGAILLEAPIVNVTGALTANGGAGGAPAGGADGARGTLTSRTPAVGGAFSCVPTPGATPVTRRGGSGAAGTTAPTNGSSCTVQDAMAVTTSSQGGGGGGALGRIHIRRHIGTASGTQSPTAVVEGVTFQ